MTKIIRLSTIVYLFLAGTANSQTVSNTVNIVGAYSFHTVSPNSVNIAVERIENPSTTRTTGTLRLELWLSPAPFIGLPTYGYRIAASLLSGAQNGALAPRQYFYAINVTTPLIGLPPAGDYYASLQVSEYTQSCGSADGFCSAAAGAFPGSFQSVGTPASPVVVEFYNSLLDNYFVTADPGEASAIDSGGAGAGWIRTGNTFKSEGNSPVCRFYGSLSPGPNSHFYTADQNECASLKNLQTSTPVTQKRWNFESLDFKTVLPVNGACIYGTAPVYRAYNNGFSRGKDSNHRITTNIGGIQEVVGRGWINEGVVMCAPL